MRNLTIQLIQKGCPSKIQNLNSKIQSIKDQNTLMGFKCKHISWKYSTQQKIPPRTVYILQTGS